MLKNIAYRDLLRDWKLLNAFLLDCTEEEAKRLLELELKAMARKSTVMRCYGRYSRLRALRERDMLNRAIRGPA